MQDYFTTLTKAHRAVREAVTILASSTHPIRAAAAEVGREAATSLAVAMVVRSDRQAHAVSDARDDLIHLVRLTADFDANLASTLRGVADSLPSQLAVTPINNQLPVRASAGARAR